MDDKLNECRNCIFRGPQSKNFAFVCEYGKNTLKGGMCEKFVKDTYFNKKIKVVYKILNKGVK